jgi:hypothetical protein
VTAGGHTDEACGCAGEGDGAVQLSDDGACRRDDEKPRLVFCGGCNPHIDRGAVAAELMDDENGAGEGATIHLSGCPRACASDHRLTSDEPGHVVVAGETVEGRPARQQDIADAVRRRLEE